MFAGTSTHASALGIVSLELFVMSTLRKCIFHTRAYDRQFHFEMVCLGTSAQACIGCGGLVIRNEDTCVRRGPSGPVCSSR